MRERRTRLRGDWVLAVDAAGGAEGGNVASGGSVFQGFQPTDGFRTQAGLGGGIRRKDRFDFHSDCEVSGFDPFNDGLCARETVHEETNLEC